MSPCSITEYKSSVRVNLGLRKVHNIIPLPEVGVRTLPLKLPVTPPSIVQFILGFLKALKSFNGIWVWANPVKEIRRNNSFFSISFRGYFKNYYLKSRAYYLKIILKFMKKILFNCAGLGLINLTKKYETIKL